MQEYKVTVISSVYVDAEDWNEAAKKGITKIVRKNKDIEHADVFKIEEINALEGY